MLFFVDESGTDHRTAPYEVLGAVGVRERDAWPLIRQIRKRQVKHFGVQLPAVGLEMKGSHLLKRKVFRNAALEDSIDPDTRRALARDFLQQGKSARESGSQMSMTRLGLIAYSQACLGYAKDVLKTCRQHKARTFAAFVLPEAPLSSNSNTLRKDVSSLVKWFYEAVCVESPDSHGLVVFDETENTKSRILIRKMHTYFSKTDNGRRVSSRVLPEPFFVQSDLTTLVQAADIVCYCLNWGYRFKAMSRPVRDEIVPYAKLAAGMRWTHPDAAERTQRNLPAVGFNYFADLRPADERNGRKAQRTKALPTGNASKKSVGSRTGGVKSKKRR